MRARYQIVKRAADARGRYTWYLLDTKTPDPGELGYRVVTSGFNNNPINAPSYIIRRQAELNTRDYLD